MWSNDVGSWLSLTSANLVEGKQSSKEGLSLKWIYQRRNKKKVDYFKRDKHWFLSIFLLLTRPYSFNAKHPVGDALNTKHQRPLSPSNYPLVSRSITAQLSSQYSSSHQESHAPSSVVLRVIYPSVPHIPPAFPTGPSEPPLRKNVPRAPKRHFTAHVKPDHALRLPPSATERSPRCSRERTPPRYTASPGPSLPTETSDVPLLCPT
ncbi:hypothetical protein B0T11DRAFT_85992 [Plectosphaerella cucumerina]|uniref:Uncharacterized protein n=1 Tax=Plectosphaerella cucumerina TaxID=40658 RepID=A0A8K0TH53_9PEZI|nr:hypothetical protein B0T11DRAFT_85992 [Plectosphaerella cucumerina]